MNFNFFAKEPSKVLKKMKYNPSDSFDVFTNILLFEFLVYEKFLISLPYISNIIIFLILWLLILFIIKWYDPGLGYILILSFFSMYKGSGISFIISGKRRGLILLLL